MTDALLELEFAAGMTARGCPVDTGRFHTADGRWCLHSEREGVLILFAIGPETVLDAQGKNLYTATLALNAIIGAGAGLERRFVACSADTVGALLSAIDATFAKHQHRHTLGLKELPAFGLSEPYGR